MVYIVMMLGHRQGACNCIMHHPLWFNVPLLCFQDAVNLLQNFNEQYKIINSHELQLDTTSEKERKGHIFKVAVAFEKFVLNYGHYHLNESAAQISIANNKLCKWKHFAYILGV